MAYDNVNYKAFCPQCGGFLTGWQSKSGSCTYETIEVWRVRDMMAMCSACGATVTATVDAEVEHVVKHCDVRLMVGRADKSATPAYLTGSQIQARQALACGPAAEHNWEAGAAHAKRLKEHAEDMRSWPPGVERPLFSDMAMRAAARQERLDAIVANLGSGMTLAEATAAHKRDAEALLAASLEAHRVSAAMAPYSDMRDAERWQWFIRRGGVWPTDTGIKRPPAELTAMADRAMLAERNHDAP